MKYATLGIIHGPEDILSVIPKAASKVKSWQNGKSPATQDITFNALKANGCFWESVYDAGHGRRYMLFVYRTKEERKGCWGHVTGEDRA